jgi:hypothetical protein
VTQWHQTIRRLRRFVARQVARKLNKIFNQDCFNRKGALLNPTGEQNNLI